MLQRWLVQSGDDTSRQVDELDNSNGRNIDAPALVQCTVLIERTESSEQITADSVCYETVG